MEPLWDPRDFVCEWCRTTMQTIKARGTGESPVEVRGRVVGWCPTCHAETWGDKQEHPQPDAANESSPPESPAG